MSEWHHNLHRRIDHALLVPEADERAIRKACDEAVKHRLYALAINPGWVAVASEQIRGSDVKVLSVAGFPLSAVRTDVKLFEAAKGVADGAHEIDMVANVGWLASGRFKEAEDEIRQMRDHLPYNVLLKVIIEAGKLTTAQQADATKAVVNGGAQFVKTCTGFFGGATVDMVQRLSAAADGQIEVKASGGIKTLAQCRELIEAGASRLGTSSSVSIMGELADQLPSD